jgi:chromosome segregation ATPase
MSDRTKLIIAITLGSLGVALGALGTVVAFNAKSEADSSQQVAGLVDERFAEAQTRQDRLEEKQASQAEKLVANLTDGEKNLVGKIDSNGDSIATLRKRVNSQQEQINALKSTNRKQSNQISNLQKQVQQNFNSLSDRIDRTNQRISGSGGG